MLEKLSDLRVEVKEELLWLEMRVVQLVGQKRNQARTNGRATSFDWKLNAIVHTVS